MPDEVYPKSEKDWQAWDDAKTLARANRINEDPARLNAAKSAAQKIAEEESKEANAMKKVARGQKTRPKTDGKETASFNVFQKI